MSAHQLFMLISYAYDAKQKHDRDVEHNLVNTLVKLLQFYTLLVKIAHL